jgi:hypothetical protein
MDHFPLLQSEEKKAEIAQRVLVRTQQSENRAASKRSSRAVKAVPRRALFPSAQQGLLGFVSFCLGFLCDCFCFSFGLQITLRLHERRTSTC